MGIAGVNSVHGFYDAVINKIVDKMPAVTFNNKKVTDAIKWSGQHISSPQNRLILGVTALMSQPFIDLHNHKVDEKTRKQSAARTVAKIIAGTTTGFFVRYYCIKAIDAFTNKPEKGVPKYKSAFYPKNIVHIAKKELKQHKMGLGTLISLGVMVFTNFLIDAPLTKFLTNKFISRIDKQDAQKAKEADNG